MQLPFRSPNLNAHVERFIQSLQNECLRKFLILGTRHLDHLVMEYVQHYNLERPHSRIGHRTPAGRAPPLRIAKRDNLDARGILCSTRLGGVLRHYRRSAA
ncbi:MAG: transposase [Phycisphaerales bacterium]|nr:transposase [Phycisphaerales bacterium]